MPRVSANGLAVEYWDDWANTKTWHMTRIDVDFYISAEKELENPYIEYTNYVTDGAMEIQLEKRVEGKKAHVTGGWSGNVTANFYPLLVPFNPSVNLHWNNEESIMLYIPVFMDMYGFNVDTGTSECNRLKVGPENNAILTLKSTKALPSNGVYSFTPSLHVVDKSGNTIRYLSMSSSTSDSIIYEIPFEIIEKGAVAGSFAVIIYKNDKVLDSASGNFYIEPADGVADIENVTFAVTPVSDTVPEEWGGYVQGKSHVHTEANATIAYGELTFDVTVGEKALQGKSLDFDNEMQAGEVRCSLTVTDDWGRSQSREAGFSVWPYAVPRIESIKAVRCDESGSETETGTSYKAGAVTTYSDCNGHNTQKLTLYSKLSSETEYALVGEIPIGEELIVPGGAPDVEKSYDVCFVLMDTFNTVRYYAAVMTGDYFMYFRRGGKGVAVGKASERDNLFDVGYDMRVRGDTVLDGELTINRPDGSSVTITQILEALGL